MALEHLLTADDVTAEAILDAADDAREVLDAAGQVFGLVEQASKRAEEAIEANSQALERLRATTGADDFAGCLLEQSVASRKAEEALEACQAAWRRYRPWQEAAERIDTAVRFMRQIESN